MRTHVRVGVSRALRENVELLEHATARAKHISASKALTSAELVFVTSTELFCR